MKKTAVFDRYAIERCMSPLVSNALVPYISVPAGGHILDAGCGDGSLLAFCQQVAPHEFAAGTDISWIRVHRAAQKGFIVSQADVERLPFAGRSFDLVLLIEVIEHVECPQAVLAEITRVLTPHGRLVLTTPNYPVKRVYDWLSYLRGTRSSPADDPTHFSPLSARRIKRLCTRYFAAVEAQASHIAGEGRWSVMARMKSVPLVADLIGHKMVILCQTPLPGVRP